MKFKYYLRGVGIGVIVTTLLFTIAFAFYKPTLSDAEIIKKAQALGMEKVEEKKETTEQKKKRPMQHLRMRKKIQHLQKKQRM